MLKNDWHSWYKNNQEGDYAVEPASIDNMSGWHFYKVKVNGEYFLMFGPEKDGPFRVQPIKVTTPDRSYYLPLLRRVPEDEAFGYVAIAVDKKSDRYILQAKKEPGYSSDMKYTAIAPPVQMSAYNYLQKHGGPKPPRSEWVSQAFMLPVPQDGGMFLLKENMVGFIEMDIDEVELYPTERIFTSDELKEALQENLCNDHVLQALGMLKMFRG